jgi:hypothetical protein
MLPYKGNYMIKPICIKPIAFRGTNEYLESGVKRSFPSELGEDVDNLGYLLEIPPENVAHSSMTVQDGKTCYAITLKNGEQIKLNGQQFLEVSREALFKNKPQEHVNEHLKWSMGSHEAHFELLNELFLKVFKHIDNLWIKIP